MNNLLSNAFKFTPKKGHIQVRILKDEGNRQIQVEVADSGCGIAKDEQAQIFDRFYQAKNQKNLTGSGIGLHLVKEYAGLHNGSVAVESRINVGSVFTVTLSTDLKPQNRTNLPNGDNEANKSLKILVIDDHLEFRNFLFNELSEKYKVIMASDGKEGLQKAQIELPDLIVSDVMMPVMSGTELCQQLKANLAVSHIPVILLTAKTSDEAQIEGFEAGADAYISKPFNMEILLLRIENLLEQQAKRKELFRKSIVITPASLATSTVDEELIKKVLGLIEANMNNGNYSVEQLSKDMYMDRTGLYRKLMAITGQAPTEFIRAVRLKKAAQMLQHGQSVSEVAEQVGFGSNSYFTKCFQEEFGVKPSKYKDTTINAR
jgi:DNA-binding response OmpR family regulator/anti-sigma regulatory factor (Ser/Thr protein kinase)